MLAWSSSWGASMITTSSAWAISGTRWCRLREGRATIRNGKAVLGGSLGSMAARSDHSRALPEGSASTRSTLFPAWAKMCASQTADVVLPVPGLRLSRATLSAVINAVLQYLRHYGSLLRRYRQPAAELSPQASHPRRPPARPPPAPDHSPPGGRDLPREQRSYRGSCGAPGP